MKGALGWLISILMLAVLGVAGGLVSLHVFDESFWLGVPGGVLVVILTSAGVQTARDAIDRRRLAVVESLLEQERRAQARRASPDDSRQRVGFDIPLPQGGSSQHEPEARADTEGESPGKDRESLGGVGIEFSPSVTGRRFPRRGTDMGSEEPLDVLDLRSRLHDLLNAYRLALRFVERLPPVGRHPVRSTGYWSQLWSRRLDEMPLKEQRRLIVRPLLRVFVEAHTRRQLLHLIRVLRIETLGIHPSDTRATSLMEIVIRLTEAERALFGWSRLRSVIAKAPFVPAVLTFALAFYGVATGLDLTSPAAFGRTTAESAQSLGWEGVARGLSVLLLGAIIVYTIVLSPVAVLGFKRKRALFSGGATAPGDEVLAFPLLFLPRGRTLWEGFPNTNIYEVENGVFGALRVTKRHEFAVDIFLSPFPYYALWGAVLVAADALREGDRAGLLGPAFLAAIVIISRVSVLRGRWASSIR